jgi:type IV pilus assembly protein PilQ
MKIFITKNDIATITAGVPSLSTNEAQTELLVNDGDTIVIGGIVKTTIQDSTIGWPG